MSNQPLKLPDGLDDANLHAISYSFVERTATLIYKRGAIYNIRAIMEYVNDMTDGRAVRIVVSRGDYRTHELFRKADGEWGGIDNIAGGAL